MWLPVNDFFETGVHIVSVHGLSKICPVSYEVNNVETCCHDITGAKYQILARANWMQLPDSLVKMLHSSSLL